MLVVRRLSYPPHCVWECYGRMHFCPLCSNLLLIHEDEGMMKFKCATCPYNHLIDKLDFTSLHFTPLHSSPTPPTPPHSTSLHFTSHHFTPLHPIPLHPTSLHFTSLHFTSFHFISYAFPFTSLLSALRQTTQEVFVRSEIKDQTSWRCVRRCRCLGRCW